MPCTHSATEVADAVIEHCPICQQAEIERLRAALKPFADTANCIYRPDRADKTTYSAMVPLIYLDAARDAYEQIRVKTDG